MGYGSKLKDELERQGKSVYWLSRETGIPKTTLYGMIRRDAQDVKTATEKRIAEALGGGMKETNGDVIRKMTDKELVRLLVCAAIQNIPYSEEYGYCVDCAVPLEGASEEECEECMLAWLKRPFGRG